MIASFHGLLRLCIAPLAITLGSTANSAEPPPSKLGMGLAALHKIVPKASPDLVVVRPGDTLFSIARRNKVTVRALITTNDLTNSRLVPGQELFLPPY